MDFETLTQVKKGNVGEKIVREYLHDKGYVVYEPISNRAHPFDKLAVKDKENMVIIEVKSKARMNNYNATGFDITSHKYYNLLRDKYNLPLFVFFVDEYLQKIYGNKLSILEQHYIDKQGIEYPNFDIVRGIVLFPLDKMIDIYKLSDFQRKELEMYSTRNYQYDIF